MALSDDNLWDLWNAQGTDDMSCAVKTLETTDEAGSC